jgi:C4-dicarboxylate-specific signal transduction histidine kinase
MARRLQVFQSQELHREKLIALGTMAAGLMHELNNPGAAARRAASQMRENLGRLQQISLRLCSQRRHDSKVRQSACVFYRSRRCNPASRLL